MASRDQEAKFNGFDPTAEVVVPVEFALEALLARSNTITSEEAATIMPYETVSSIDRISIAAKVGLETDDAIAEINGQIKELTERRRRIERSADAITTAAQGHWWPWPAPEVPPFPFVNRGPKPLVVEYVYYLRTGEIPSDFGPAFAHQKAYRQSE